MDLIDDSNEAGAEVGELFQRVIERATALGVDLMPLQPLIDQFELLGDVGQRVLIGEIEGAIGDVSAALRELGSDAESAFAAIGGSEAVAALTGLTSQLTELFGALAEEGADEYSHRLSAALSEASPGRDLDLGLTEALMLEVASSEDVLATFAQERGTALAELPLGIADAFETELGALSDLRTGELLSEEEHRAAIQSLRDTYFSETELAATEAFSAEKSALRAQHSDVVALEEEHRTALKEGLELEKIDRDEYRAALEESQMRQSESWRTTQMEIRGVVDDYLELYGELAEELITTEEAVDKLRVAMGATAEVDVTPTLNSHRTALEELRQAALAAAAAWRAVHAAAAAAPRAAGSGSGSGGRPDTPGGIPPSGLVNRPDTPGGVPPSGGMTVVVQVRAEGNLLTQDDLLDEVERAAERGAARLVS